MRSCAAILPAPRVARMPTGRPRVVVLRGHNTNVWDLRPLEQLQDEFDVTALVTGSNLHDLDGLGLPSAPTRTPRDLLPGGRAAGAAAYAVGERYLRLGEHLRGADIVHAAEIGTWFTAQAARLKRRLGFRLLITVWETLPWGQAYRWPRERRYRQAIVPEADLCLAATGRARDALLLEGMDAERVEVSAPGIDLDAFSTATARDAGPTGHTILSAGRLVWEKGHQDVMRAVAALRRGLADGERHDVRLLVVGDGPERDRLRRHAAELDLRADVEFRATVPYGEMPGLYRSASCLVLASLPTRSWEEQFGMVLAEAMACGTPIVAAASGAIPEVVGDYGTLVEPGDWMGIARALARGPLSREPAARAQAPTSLLERYSATAAAERTRAAYRRLLS
jgi:glycosyltransferase involved in cell wall biosynthesis